MEKKSEIWEKYLIKKYGASWRITVPSLAKTFDALVGREEKEAKKAEKTEEREKEREKEAKEQFLFELKAKIQEVFQRLPKTLDELETEIMELLNSETTDIAERFKQLSRVQYLIRDYQSKIISLDVQEPHKLHFKQKVQELARFVAVEEDFKNVLDARTKELLKDFDILRIIVKKGIKSKHEVRE